MQAPLRSWSLAIAVALACGPLVAAEPIAADLLLREGTLYDGTGGDGVVGDVAIRDGKIVAVGKFEAGVAEMTLECRGLVIAPGFIDLHNHSDSQMVDRATRANVNSLMQGCTTIVTGNCGAGPVDVGKYFGDIESAGAGTNVIHLLPHGSLRALVLGSADKPLTPDDLKQMQELADKAMRDGAWGMSTGLIYVPGTYARTEELIELAKVVGRHGGIYASHIRNEGLELLASVDEALEIGRQASLPVHISHFKSSGPEAWGLVLRAAEQIEKARKAGQTATADQYPYIASSTSLEAMLIPAWARSGGQEELLKRLDDPPQAKRIQEAILNDLDKRGSQAPIRIARYKPRPSWLGKSLGEIADEEKRAVLDVVLEITRNGGAAAVSFGMSEDDVRHVMQLPWVATASDGRAYVPNADRPHPRSYGTFSRKIGYYAIDKNVLPLGLAIRSCSGLPADILQLPDRGYLRAGDVADVCIFDPRTFRDAATYEQPHRYSTGIRHVFVSGQPAVFDGVPTGALAGKPLRRGRGGSKRSASSRALTEP